MKIIDVANLPFNALLWTSYGIVALIMVLVFFLTKKPKIKWTKKPTEIEVLQKGTQPLEKGKSYFIQEPKNEKSLAILEKAVKLGVPGLCLTRNNPKSLKVDMGDAKVIWLTELSTENAVNPMDLEEISYTINQHITNVSPHSLILFDGIEYLISFAGFNKVLHLIQDLRDTMALHGSVLLVPLSEPTLALEDSTLLHKELEAVPS